MRLQKSNFEKIYISGASAGLARSHRLIRIEREKELIFMRLYEKIKIESMKSARSDNQRESRKLKRKSRLTRTE
jgi:hypothetical protein